MAVINIVLSVEARERGITNLHEESFKHKEGCALKLDKHGRYLQDYEITRNNGSKFMLREGIRDKTTGLHRYVMTTDYEPDIRNKKTMVLFSDGEGLNFSKMQTSPEYMRVLVDMPNALLGEKRLQEKREKAKSFGLENTAFIAHVAYDLVRGNYYKAYVCPDEDTLSMLKTFSNVTPKNVVEYSRSIERCRSVILDGTGFSKPEGDISLGRDMWASSRIGSRRKNQEDAVALFESSVADFKMAVVADGMGGGSYGERASRAVVKKLGNWFGRLDSSYYEDHDLFIEEMTDVVERINEEVRNDLQDANSGSTLTCAVTCRNKTVIANVGDSRAYLLGSTGLKQITRDDSYVDSLVAAGEVKKDDARFHKNSNIITNFIGNEGRQVLTYFVAKRGLPVLLVSDGVSDCLSESEIAIVSENTDIDKLSKILVDKALTTNSTARDELGSEYYKEILGGKDNASAAVIR